MEMEILRVFWGNYILSHVIYKHFVLLTIHIVSELKGLAYNAKIRSSLKIQLIQYIFVTSLD